MFYFKQMDVPLSMQRTVKKAKGIPLLPPAAFTYSDCNWRSDWWGCQTFNVGPL